MSTSPRQSELVPISSTSLGALRGCEKQRRSWLNAASAAFFGTILASTSGLAVLSTNATCVSSLCFELITTLMGADVLTMGKYQMIHGQLIEVE